METVNLNSPEDALKLISFIEEATTFVDEWTPTQINSGGCGYFALLLYDKLNELGLKPKILALFFKGEKADDAERNLTKFVAKGENLSKSGMSHACVEIFDLFYIDSTGIVNPEVMHSRKRIEITREQLEEINEKGIWNPTFDKECIPLIKDKLDCAFQKYNEYKSGIFERPQKGIPYTKHTVKELQDGVSIFSRLMKM